MDLVEAHDRLGNPTRAKLYRRQLQLRKLFEHSIEHQHRHDGLDALVQNRGVAGAHVFAAAHPVATDAAASVAPRRFQLQGVAADMKHDRHLRLLQHRPDWVEVDMGRRALARQAVRDPHRLETVVECPLDLGDRQVWVLERNRGDAHEAAIHRTEVDHVPVVGARPAVAQFVGYFCARRERHVQTVG